jgi:N-acetylglucosamine-6-phosphate deacetylase
LAYAGAETTETNHPNIIVEDGVCKSADHANLVGSIATMDVLVKNMVKAGVQLEHVLRMASETPARLMNVYDRKGSLEKGKDADILIIDAEQNVRAIWAMGKLVEGSNTLWK